MNKLKKVMLFNNDIFKDLKLSYNQKELQDGLIKHLNQFNYNCETNVECNLNLSIRTGKGRINTVAKKGDFSYGIEISYILPRKKSINKLFDNDYSRGIILLRNDKITNSYNIGDIEVIPIKCT